MKNVVSIDVEEWYHRPIISKHLEKDNTKTSNVEAAIKQILETFSRHRKRSTFFILGEVAERMPELVQSIYDEGHEVAYHGYSHKTLQELGPEDFKVETEKGQRLLKKITGEAPSGFRAPVFSLNPETSWALEELEKQGFRYDSSIVPAKTWLYGSESAPQTMYYPDYNDPTTESSTQRGLIEFPVMTSQVLGKRIPLGGGFYFRALGLYVFKNHIKKLNENGQPAMLYFHPWELCGFPRIKLPLHEGVFAYYNSKCLPKLENLIRAIDVAPAGEILNDLGHL